MRELTAALLGAALGGLTLFSSDSRAQNLPPLPAASAPSAALPHPSSVTPVKEPSYWRPAPPKPKPSAFRRFLGRFMGPPQDLGARQEGFKVYRDPATGRTNTLNSKPWMDARP